MDEREGKDKICRKGAIEIEGEVMKIGVERRNMGVMIFSRRQ